jgi:hypothetical protein
VEYALERQKEIVQRVLDLFRGPMLDAAFDPDRLQRIAGVLTLSFVLVRSMMKNPAYHSEKEYRLIDALPKDAAHHDIALESFRRGTRDVPFFRVDLRASNADASERPVREVWIGPCLDASAATAAIEATTAYAASAFPIHVSTVPMRRD